MKDIELLTPRTIHETGFSENEIYCGHQSVCSKCVFLDDCRNDTLSGNDSPWCWVDSSKHDVFTDRYISYENLSDLGIEESIDI